MINGYIEESNENKYLTLVPTDKSKETLRMFEELWRKIKDLIRSINDNSGNYDKNIWKSNSVQVMSNLYEFHFIIIGVKSVFHEDNKCNPQVFLDEY